MGKARKNIPFHEIRYPETGERYNCAVSGNGNGAHFCMVCMTEFDKGQFVVCPNYIHQKELKEKENGV